MKPTNQIEVYNDRRKKVLDPGGSKITVSDRRNPLTRINHTDRRKNILENNNTWRDIILAYNLSVI